jgi:hypothetical protein
MSPITKFRNAVNSVKAWVKAIPVMIDEMKHHTEREVLRAKVHQHVDTLIETYGDIAVELCKKVDIDMLSSIAYDAIALVEKWKEPLKLQGEALSEGLNAIMTKHVQKINKTSEEAGTILEKMMDDLKWRERFTPDADKLTEVENNKKFNCFNIKHDVFMFKSDIFDADTANELFGDDKRIVNVEELTKALTEEQDAHFTRREGESVNEYWLRCKDKFVSKIVKSNYITTPEVTEEKKSTRSSKK